MKGSMFSIFRNFPNLICIISEKKDGTMKLSGDIEADKIVIENRKKFLKRLKINEKSLVRADLVHGNKVIVINREDARRKIANTDGLLTSEKNLFLSITVADCLPIFLYDCEKNIIGLIHGGWKNLVKGILEETIKKLIKNFGGFPQNILVGIGPGISQCHFEVKEDILSQFEPTLLKETLVKKDKKQFLDLKEIARLQLLNLGLKKKNIEICPECTFCFKDKYFSYRREKSEILKTMIAIIGMRG